MDTAAVIAMESVLRLRSVRAAARALERPASSIAASIARFEAEVSLRLVERAGSGLVLSLEAVRLEDEIAAAAALAQTISARQAVKFDTLERFLQVARLGSIRRAARALDMGQPQLTRQIAQLEAVLGTPLLVRASGGSTVTAEGAQIARAAEHLLALWHRLTQASEDRFRKSAATSRLGSVMPLGYESEIAQMLANLAARWLAERPRAPLFVSATTADDLLAGLKSGLFDAAFLDTEHLPPDLDGEVIGRTPLAIVGASSASSLADALLSGPLAVPSARSGLRQRINHILDEQLSAVERGAVRLIEIDSIPVILNLVLNHGFVSVLPQASVARIRSDLPQITLDVRYAMNLWLCWRRGNGEALGRALIAAIAE